VLDAHLSLLPRSLRSLNLAGCHKITNQGMPLLPPVLEHLDLSECFLVSDIGLRSLSGVVGRTRDEIEEEERERARLVAEQQQREEAEAERRRRKGKAKLDDDGDAITSADSPPELDFAPEVIAALPDLVSDDEDADEESTAQHQPQPESTEPKPELAAGDVGRQLLPVVDNPPFPHLTSLLLHKCFAVSSLDFLPRTLEELDISHLNLNFAGRCFTSLPPTIKKLTVTYVAAHQFLFSIYISFSFSFQLFGLWVWSVVILIFICFLNGHTGTAVCQMTACGTCRRPLSTWISRSATSSPTPDYRCAHTLP
jgi:hypothetical protein